jgi:hypothetical protein
MLNSHCLRRRAALCLRIAAAVDDQGVVTALLTLAEEFSVKADEVDPSLRSSPGASLRPNGAGGSQ